jgi:glycosyltransferase involved in cell wall biosynthesis
MANTVPLRVTFYCPDRHITYDGRTPVARGIGGGITTRVRVGRALADLGNSVTMVVNCPTRETIDGVDYVPLDDLDRLEGDVVVFTTSGDRLDLTPALGVPVNAGIRIVWCHGEGQPRGLSEIDADYVYVVSQFIGRAARDEWHVPEDKIVVAYNGYDEDLMSDRRGLPSELDRFRLVYFSHPSKGLAAAMAVSRILRQGDGRFSLDIYGGPDLWGGRPEAYPETADAIFHGTVGQETLVGGLLRAGFALQLQTRQEPGALAIPEAQACGCVIVGSPVGCYPELVHHDVDGFLIPGDPTTVEVQERAAELIASLANDPSRLDRVSMAAQASALGTRTAARSWECLWNTGHRSDVIDALPGVSRLVLTG